eukprot:UN01039
MNKALFIALCAMVMLALAAVASAKNYAVIAAGSNTYSNYRHQSDIAAHYQMLRKRGYSDDEIIVFAYDDIAQNPSNPLKGEIYNEPCTTQPECTNNYPIKVDYAGKACNAKNFVNVLIGNKTADTPIVLETGPQDNILITFSDHGSPGLLAFPNDYLYVAEWKRALETMSAKNMYNKLAIYIEACESGSMGIDVLTNVKNAVILTASDAKQSSYGKYCGSEAKVAGVSINSCLADEFAWALRKFVDENGVENQTVGDHYNYLLTAVEKSPVQFFPSDGVNPKEWKLTEFFAQVGFTSEQEAELRRSQNPSGLLGATRQFKSTQLVNSRDNSLHYLFNQYLDSEQQLGRAQRLTAGEELLEELKHRIDADKRFDRIVTSALSNIAAKYNINQLNTVSAEAIHNIESIVSAVNCGRCCQSAFEAVAKSPICNFSDYSLKYARSLHNVCTLTQSKDVTSEVVQAIKQHCTQY